MNRAPFYGSRGGAVYGRIVQIQRRAAVREPEALLFATKRDQLAGIYQTYVRRESATLEKLGYRLEEPQRVDSYTEFLLKWVRPANWRS